MRVLLADNQSQVRAALQLLLKQELDVYVVGEAVDYDSLLAQIRISQPDVILLDWGLPGLLPECTSMLRGFCPQLNIIALSGRPELRRAALLAGADAFVSKVDAPDKLLAALRTVHTPAQNSNPPFLTV